MKLFWREHLPLIGLQLLTLATLVLIFWLDGYRNAMTVLYAVFLGLVLLSGYLTYRYITRRALYRRLSEPLPTLDASVLTHGRAPLAEAMDRLLRTQYDHYQERLIRWEKRQQEHLTFMNQWVHQMKTPLSVIHLTVQEHEGDGYASIAEEAERIERGLETVLYAARLEAFEQDFQVESLPLRTIVERAIHEHKRLFIRSRVYPEVQVPGEVRVETDAKWLLFVLGQLTSNAVKYSAGTETRVVYAAAREPDAIVLEVRDRGVGIPQRDLRRVLQPFYTGDNGRTHRESTGMGLYLAAQICERLGHRIELRSEVGVGTTVRLHFLSSANLTAM
ncbi:sensor histidine kinase [Paenibacillus sp. IB182496]|uniref:histidine kinase n=1 Tax=Paenibacillus sabuli TaxID=2772509 RepID=A0A927BVL7_9BACL|nr:sensor histidine kinase [Paenibacillus sabuli]MBD2846475.1 sensor histidine kinase [Paenibacillus sabuli]